ncbi:MAG: subtilase family protease [Parcubacteria group bacterium]|nr:subtilase family protease [Parcubacteria group bacterium]
MYKFRPSTGEGSIENGSYSCNCPRERFASRGNTLDNVFVINPIPYMKNYILGVLIALGFLTPVFASAQLMGDVPPSGTATSCVTLTHNLIRGSNDITTGGDVSELQDFLQTKGYLAINPTGYFGVLTYNAVRSYQSANGILASGYVGPITRAKINADSCSGTSTTPPTTSTVPGCVAGQIYSSTTGNDCGCPVGAIFSSATGNACPTTTVTACTADAKLCPDGSYVSRGGPSCTFAACPSTIPGCAAGQIYSSTTGAACNGSTISNPIYLPGCTSYAGFSSVNGTSCDGSVTSRDITVNNPISNTYTQGEIIPITWNGLRADTNYSLSYNTSGTIVTIGTYTAAQAHCDNADKCYINWTAPDIINANVTIVVKDNINGRSGTSASFRILVPAMQPNITLTATPSTVVSGQGVVLAYNVTNANTCTASGGWSGTFNGAGDKGLYYPTQTTTYTLSCTGTNGTLSTRSVIVTVNSGDTAWPTITSVTPSDGKVKPGDRVYLYGKFTSSTYVAWDYSFATSRSVTPDSLSSTVLSFIVPTSAGVGSHAVTVAEKASPVSNGVASTVTLSVVSSTGSTPTITSLSPTSGLVGSYVTVNGTGFTNSDTVYFNGAPVSSATSGYSSSGPTGWIITVPSGQTCSSSGCSIQVRNANGSSNIMWFTIAPLVVSPAAQSLSACNLDVDGNGIKDALTDGLLIKRYLNGTRGDSLISSVIATNATRRDAGSIESYIASHNYDVDGDGTINSLSDGNMILQYLFDPSGSSITTGMIGATAVRKSVPDIVVWLNACGPQVLGAQKFILSQYTQVGSTGNEVLELQKVLTRLGYYHDELTGYFGEITKAAVISFQAANDLPTEGSVGPLTREKLNSL